MQVCCPGGRRKAEPKGNCGAVRRTWEGGPWRGTPAARLDALLPSQRNQRLRRETGRLGAAPCTCHPLAPVEETGNPISAPAGSGTGGRPGTHQRRPRSRRVLRQWSFAPALRLVREGVSGDGAQQSARTASDRPGQTTRLGTAGCVNRTSGGVCAGEVNPPRLLDAERGGVRTS